MAYLLDMHVFIAAKNLHYGLDFCPAFWDWLIVSHSNGTVFSVEKVSDEIQAGADELSSWAASLPPGFSVSRHDRTPLTRKGQHLGNEQPLRTDGNQHVPALLL